MNLKNNIRDNLIIFTMENHIYLQSAPQSGLHFGRNANYQSFIGGYFEEKEGSEPNIIYKAIIPEILYSPDTLYIDTDGNAGTCWIALVIDEGYTHYHFRNFEDLVHLYDQKGYKYVAALNMQK
jgi:hypothetical protein